jgi:hypothetical protein
MTTTTIIIIMTHLSSSRADDGASLDGNDGDGDDDMIRYGRDVQQRYSHSVHIGCSSDCPTASDSSVRQPVSLSAFSECVCVRVSECCV